MNIQLVKEAAIEFFQSLEVAYTSIVVEEDGGRMWVKVIPMEDASRAIGYRGQNLAAMQQLFTLLLWEKGCSKDMFIVLDIDGYKKKNEEKIMEIVEKKIAMCDASGMPQTMPFLGPQERRLVHVFVLEKYPQYQTESFTDSKGTRVLQIVKKSVQESLLS